MGGGNLIACCWNLSVDNIEIRLPNSLPLPVGFLMAHWHEGGWGATRMGAGHGFYCLGCCWLLMMLLFVLGVMNLLWIAALTVFVLAEKVVPRGYLLGRIAGFLMIFWGAWLLYFAQLGS